jgi:hypothetical protein
LNGPQPGTRSSGRHRTSGAGGRRIQLRVRLPGAAIFHDFLALAEHCLGFLSRWRCRVTEGVFQDCITEGLSWRQASSKLRAPVRNWYGTEAQGDEVMHVLGAFELDIQPGTPTTRHPSGLPFYATLGARTGACSAPRSPHTSRKYRDRSILYNTSWTRSGNEPAELSKSPDPRLHDRV